MSSQTRSTACPTWHQAVLFLLGLAYLLTGLALLFTPTWFFAHIGPFAPFNRHYEGDLGAFTLPLGIALLAAAQHPERHRSLVAVVAGASWLHALNHAYDALGQPLRQWLADTLPLAAAAVLAHLAYAAIGRNEGRKGGVAA